MPTFKHINQSNQNLKIKKSLSILPLHYLFYHLTITNTQTYLEKWSESRKLPQPPGPPCLQIFYNQTLIEIEIKQHFKKKKKKNLHLQMCIKN